VTANAAVSVTATFSLNPSPPPPSKLCIVPNVKGKTLAAARRALKAHDCRLGKIKRAFSKRVKKGRVISQKPRAHRHLAAGAKVALTLSKGKQRHKR
jgi:beta-lactam-binding protein with PASTA domain